MKKSIYSFLAMMAICLVTCSTLKATHIMGGELTYTWISGNDYEIKLALYRDCAGIAAPATADVTVSSTSCSVSGLTVTLNPGPGSPVQVSPTCPGILTTCNGGTITGVEKWEYTGIVTLPSACSDYQITYSECCRNASITNLVNAAAFGAQFQAKLDNLNVPFNSSPRFANNPVLFLDLGNLHNINNGAFDPDGDSLSIVLSPAINDTGGVMDYEVPFTYQLPMSSSTPLVIDPVTGNLTVTPALSEVDVVVFTVNEYRNGTFIGSVSRDIQIVVSNSTNQLPSLSGVNGSANYFANACVGDTLSFMVYSSDADLSDSTFISWSAPGIPSLTVTSFGASNDSALVELITDTSMLSAAPYVVNMTVTDNNCPFNGLQSYAFQLYVNGCSADIWPGDANADLSCDLYDVLPIGLGYGASGPVRPAATTNWVAESGSNWTQDFISGVNYKHADCNGDGMIDNADTTAISLNYGLTHPLRLSSPNLIASNNFMYLTASQDSAGSADTFSINVQLGSLANPVNPIYGIAFNLNFNPVLVDSSLSSFNFVNSALGTPGSNMLTYVRTDWAAGQIAAVAIRNDQSNSFSDTTIALFDVVIIDNVSARAYSRFSLSGIRGVTADGLLHSFTAVDDSVDVNTTTVGINPVQSAFPVILYPNPAKNEIILVTETSLIGTVIIYDMSGRNVLETESSELNHTIDISTLSNGVYWASINSDKGTVYKKISVSR